MTVYWAEHVQLPDRVAERVRMPLVNGRFGVIEVEVEPQLGEERLAGVVLPGLANAHSHAFHRALRGRTQADGGTFWTWRRQMYAVAERLDPDRYLALARALYAEMALAGYTVVGEFHYLHHGPGGRRYADPNAMGEALLQAAAEAGIKITLLDACYLAGGLTATGHTEVNPAQRRFADRDVQAWAARVADLDRFAGPQARIGAAAHSVRAVPAADLAAVAALSGDRPLHLHLSERSRSCRAAAGRKLCE